MTSATYSSLGSGGIAGRPMALCSQPLPARVVGRLLRLGGHRIVFVEVGQLQPQCNGAIVKASFPKFRWQLGSVR